MLPGFAPLVPGNDILVNDFRQYTPGATPADWTNRYVTGGFTYVVQTVSGSISGQALRWTKSAANRQAISWNVVPNIADVEVLIRARAIESWANSENMIAPFVRGSGSAGTETGYRAVAVGNTSSTLWSSTEVSYVSGTATQLDANPFGPSPNYTVNTWFYIRFRVVGSTVQHKIWQSGSAEPGTWAATVTNTAVTTAGWVGLQQANTNPNVEIDYFAVSLAGRTIPVPV